MNIELTREIFLNDVKDHLITIIKDDGLYRHIRCSKGDSWDMGFDIITWPGKLAYTGDMGSFMFSRIEDMFQFFRNDKGRINTGYWSEKVIAESIYGEGVSKFSVEGFRDIVLEDTRRYFDLEEDEKIPEEIMEEIDCLLNKEDEYDCITAIRDFSSDKIEFNDFWEHSLNRKTWHYVWCCYALVWAISEYDKSKNSETPELLTGKEKG